MIKHWFTILIVLIVFFFAAFCLVISLSPREDLQNRGFIPCTHKLIDDLTFCDGMKLCSLKAILSNSYCDLKVIGTGIGKWAKGEQSSPWANYLFKPEYEEISEDLVEFYNDNPNIKEDMQRLKKMNEDLENERKEQQAAGVELEGIIQ
ncbi:MAG: hypothetical protein LBL47_03800 [Lactobacillus sp.]|jgi:hypothetical protein|nr:hypothetical protein [Lactobacillus sp.]